MTDQIAEVRDLVAPPDLPPAEKRRAARQLAVTDRTLSGGDIGRRFGETDRWGRRQAAVGRRAADEGAARSDDEGPPARAGVPPGDSGVTADRRAARLQRSGWARGLAVAAIVVPLIVVLLSPAGMSFHSLADYAVDRLGLTYPAAYAFPVAVDMVALLCVGLTFHAVLAGDGSAGPRAMLWALVAASSALNYRHGRTISADAAPVYAAMPVIAAVMLDLVLRRVRREVLKALGVVEAPLARYRLARWMVAPKETFGAWKVSVRENVSSPVDALGLYRAQRADQEAYVEPPASR